MVEQLRVRIVCKGKSISWLGSGGGAHLQIPALGRERQAAPYEFQARLIPTASSRPARACL